MSREVQFHSPRGMYQQDPSYPRQSGKRTYFEDARKVMEANGAEKLGDYGTLGCFCPRGTDDPECCINRLGLAAKQAQEIAKLPEVIRVAGRRWGKSPMGGEALEHLVLDACPLCRYDGGKHGPSCLSLLELSLDERKRYGV